MGQVIVILVVFLVLFLPGIIPRLMRTLGRTTRGVGQAASELATGQDQPQGPLSRYEVKAGELLRLKLEAKSFPCTEQEVVSRVEDIGARLAAGAKRRGIPYRFKVLDDAEPNAFAIPGGNVYVTRSLVELCDTASVAGADDRLAGVLGHEIAHIDLRHAAHQMAARAAVKTGVMILTRGRAAMLKQASRHLEELVTKGYGRDREFEADATGQRLASVAGFRADGLAEFLETLGASRPVAGASSPELLVYFQTHPSLQSRVERLRSGG